MARKIVLVGGCFDVLHFGHIQFLKAAKKYGDFLVVALESDEFIRKFKHRQPVHTQLERAVILKQIRAVDKVICLKLFKSYEDYLNLVKKIKPAVIAVTKEDPQLENKKKQAKLVGATVKTVINRVNNLSSNKIIAKLN